jgi:PPK2 family polyphosphate:nucleotide phosphotransferase
VTDHQPDLPDLRERLRVRAGAPLDLRAVETDDRLGFDKDTAPSILDGIRARLEGLQERLWASRGGAVLLVLQGIDTAGKGGTIRHVLTAFNPQGCTVTGFGVPTPDELAHDFLWRIHPHTPARGHVAVFDRSHYEDVLIVRVRDLVPEPVWRARYEQIVGFERHLAENGTTILKFCLLISRDEQRERLQARIDDPEKRWKAKLGDLEERKRWDLYIDAYQEALERTSTDVAPWYLIPSDRKWVRNLAVGSVLVHALEELDLRYPEAEPGIEGLRVE